MGPQDRKGLTGGDQGSSKGGAEGLGAEVGALGACPGPCGVAVRRWPGSRRTGGGRPGEGRPGEAVSPPQERASGGSHSPQQTDK